MSEASKPSPIPLEHSVPREVVGEVFGRYVAQFALYPRLDLLVVVVDVLHMGGLTYVPVMARQKARRHY